MNPKKKAKRIAVSGLILACIIFLTDTTSAEKICLQDNFGEFWELKGGRANKKSYTVKLVVPGQCVTGGIADVTTNNLGEYVIHLYNAHSTDSVCRPVLFSLIATDELLNSIGTFDILADGTIEGSSVNFTNISCAAMPSSRPDSRGTYKVHPNAPTLKKQ